MCGVADLFDKKFCGLRYRKELYDISIRQIESNAFLWTPLQSKERGRKVFENLKNLTTKLMFLLQYGLPYTGQ